MRVYSLFSLYYCHLFHCANEALMTESGFSRSSSHSGGVGGQVARYGGRRTVNNYVWLIVQQKYNLKLHTLTSFIINRFIDEIFHYFGYYRCTMYTLSVALNLKTVYSKDYVRKTM